jgi:hypothetical protein
MRSIAAAFALLAAACPVDPVVTATPPRPSSLIAIDPVTAETRGTFGCPRPCWR